MSIKSGATSQYKRVLELLGLHFREEPFHTFYHEISPLNISKLHGGTCTDLVNRFVQRLKEDGCCEQVDIHCAYIHQQPCHRIVKIQIKDQIFFVDPGNAWPCLGLYPLLKATEFQAYGHTFQTVIDENVMKVYRTYEQRYHMMDIPLAAQSSEWVLEQIGKRFEKPEIYPFYQRLRLACIVGEVFLFIRDDILYFYGKSREYKTVNIQSSMHLEEILETHFSLSYKNFGFSLKKWKDWLIEYEKRLGDIR